MVVIAFLVSFFTKAFYPIHEVGHFVFHWMSGNPARMEWSRTLIDDYSWLGTLGGPLADVIVPTLFVRIFAKRGRKRTAGAFFGIFLGHNLGNFVYGFQQGQDFANILARHGAGGAVLAVTIYVAAVILGSLFIAYTLTAMKEVPKERLTQKEKRRKLVTVGRKAA